MRANARCETIHNLIAIDTETLQRKRLDGVTEHRLNFGWLAISQRSKRGHWTKERWYRFDTVAGFYELLDRLVRPRACYYIFCHNAAFDYVVLNLLNELPRRGWRLDMCVIDAPPFILTAKRATTKLVFLDTLNWVRMPLARVGEAIKVSKLSMPEAGAADTEWDAYCRRDVLIVLRWVQHWCDWLIKNDLGGFAKTLAGQAFRTYTHRFMTSKIVIDACEPALKLAREGYHGGRVECFTLGRVEGPVHWLDVNSMYPSVMSGHMYPLILVTHDAETTMGRLCWALLEHCVVARVQIKTERRIYPVRRAGRLIFPVGEFEAVLTTPHLLEALGADEISDVMEMAIYSPGRPFDTFVEWFWQARKQAVAEGRSVDAWLAKIVMNSLYGKFGQSGRVFDTIGHTTDLTARHETIIDYETGQLTHLRQLGGLIQEFHNEGESRLSHPAIAAHVIGYAQMKLWRLIARAGLDNVYYCDTDSLVVNDVGCARLTDEIDADKLGMLKVVRVTPWAEFRGLKDYSYPDVDVIKGIRANAQEIAPGVYKQEQWRGLKGALRDGDLSTPITKMVTKTLKQNYVKGSAPSGKGKVEPLRFGLAKPNAGPLTGR